MAPDLSVLRDKRGGGPGGSACRLTLGVPRGPVMRDGIGGRKRIEVSLTLQARCSVGKSPTLTKLCANAAGNPTIPKSTEAVQALGHESRNSPAFNPSR